MYDGIRGQSAIDADSQDTPALVVSVSRAVWFNTDLFAMISRG